MRYDEFRPNKELKPAKLDLNKGRKEETPQHLEEVEQKMIRRQTNRKITGNDEAKDL